MATAATLLPLRRLSPDQATPEELGINATLARPTGNALRPAIAPLAGVADGTALPPSGPAITPSVQPPSSASVPAPGVPSIAPKPPTAPAPLPPSGPAITPRAPIGGPGLPTPQLPPPSGPTVTPGTPPPAADSGAITDFGPGNDLRFSQINPQATDRLARIQDLVNSDALKVGQGPDLTQAALDRLDALNQQTSEDRRTGIQDIGRAAAAFGRTGSGVTTGQLGDLEALLQARGLAARKDLAGSIATQEADNRRANLSSLAGLEGQTAGQEAGQRAELRGERGYQYGVGQDTLANQVLQKQLEDQLANSAAGRAAQQTELGLQGAALTGDQAAQSQDSAAQLAALLAEQQASSATAARKKASGGVQITNDAGG